MIAPRRRLIDDVRLTADQSSALIRLGSSTASAYRFVVAGARRSTARTPSHGRIDITRNLLMLDRKGGSLAYHVGL